jgi:hypothetical protein
MGAFLDFIFNNKHFREVQQAYNLVHGTARTAFEVWQRQFGLSFGKTYKEKERLFEHIAEIQEVDKWIQTVHWLRSNYGDGVVWLYSEKKGTSTIPGMDYMEYEFIATNEPQIKIFQNLLNEFNRINNSYREACERLVNKEVSDFSFEDKKKIANSEARIKEIDNELNRVKKLRNNYPLAWQEFSNGKNWETLTLIKLKSADEQAFKIKEAFLKCWTKSSELVKLILGVKKHPITSFSKEVIEQERSVLDYMSMHMEMEYKSFSMSVHLETSDELKRAIMDSENYGLKCNFVDSFDIANFYSLRDDFDKIGVNFDDAIKKEKDNESAVQAFNKEQCGHEVIYIPDYLHIVTKNSSLYSYVENYRNEREKRDKAKNIQRYYSLGFKAIFGDKKLDECPLLDIINIIDNERRILEKNAELEAIERRRRQEEEKRQIINNLKSCVSSWSHPYRASVACYSLYYYYPTSCNWNISADEWEVRKLIWDFKANPPQSQSESEIRRRHEDALNKLLPKLEMVINSYFGHNKSLLTLVCIPSSQRIVTERRYKDLAEELCNATGMSNGYPYVSVASDGEAKHLGGTLGAEFSFDTSYFKNRYILLFDDVITTGASMERFKRALESMGATVIGGLSIGKTKHERQPSNPIDLLG